jgi:outer membrane protein
MSIHRITTRVRRSALSATLALAWAVGSAAAQQPAQVITLERAIEIALERNPTVRQAENAARLSELNVLQQQRALLPNLNINTGTALPYGMPGNNFDPMVTAGVSTSMNIGNVYNTMASIQQSRINENQSIENLVRSEQTVVFTVMSNYLSLIAAQEQLAVQEQNLAAVEGQEAQIQAFVTASRRPISDLYQQQATTASARLSLLQAQRGVINARSTLVRTLHLDPFGEYQFVVPDLGSMSTEFQSLDLQEMSDRALGQRPDLRAAGLAVESAEQGVRIASASRLPSIALGFSLNSGSFNSAANGGFFDQLDQGRRGNLSLNISVPVLDFTRGITQERAAIQLQNARIGLENTRQVVATEVRNAYLDLQLAEQQLTVAEAQVQAADRAVETAQQRYEVGAATLVELTQAQLSQVRAASALVNARYELVFQSRLIDYHLGALEMPR